MSETPVGEMEAGRDLDCRVAERVMGWKDISGALHPVGVSPDAMRCYGARIKDDVPRYSTEVAAAWDVVEAMRLTVGPTDGRWFAAGFYAHETADMEGHPYIDASPHILAVADTAPLAICLAAIAAIKAGTVVPAREASVPTPAPQAPGE